MPSILEDVVTLSGDEEFLQPLPQRNSILTSVCQALAAHSFYIREVEHHQKVE